MFVFVRDYGGCFLLPERLGGRSPRHGCARAAHQLYSSDIKYPLPVGKGSVKWAMNCFKRITFFITLTFTQLFQTINFEIIHMTKAIALIMWPKMYQLLRNKTHHRKRDSCSEYAVGVWAFHKASNILVLRW